MKQVALQSSPAAGACANAFGTVMPKAYCVSTQAGAMLDVGAGARAMLSYPKGAFLSPLSREGLSPGLPIQPHVGHPLLALCTPDRYHKHESYLIVDCSI